MNLPVEAMESDTPIRVHRLSLRENSGGAGRQRGGLGVLKEYEILDGEVAFTCRGERHFFAPKGAQGGGDGAKAHAVIQRADGAQEVIPSKAMATLRAGDRIIVETAGGGGNGPASQRDPEARARDFADGPLILARLSPMDYHHVHYSDDGRTVGHDRMGGRLWTVNWHALLNKPDILFENERHISILVAEFRADWLRRNRRIVGRTHRAGTFRRQAISTR